MAAGDRIIIGVPVGALILQADSGFDETEWGWDTGTRSYLAHPETPLAKWPKKGDAAQLVGGVSFGAPAKPAGIIGYPAMFATDVLQRTQECGLLEFTVPYKGAVRYPKRERIRASGNVQVVSASATGADNITFNLDLTVPTIIREYLTTRAPTLEGVGKAVARASYLPAAPDFDYAVRYTHYTINAVSGWVLQTREWEDVAGKIWLVTETITYKPDLALS